MLTFVIYDSKFGNTEKIADAIGRGAASHGSVRLLPVAEAAAALAERPDLIVVGGPTQRHGLSPALRAFLDELGPGSLGGVAMGSFDTRYRGTTLIMGSAAAGTVKRLENVGARRVAPPESFYIGLEGKLERQVLDAGELPRAEAWGRDVAAAAFNARRTLAAAS